MNDLIREAAAQGTGPRRERRPADRLESDYPHMAFERVCRRLSARGVPVTVHAGIGYDIIHEHPNCDGAALGDASYRDFLIFARDRGAAGRRRVAELRIGHHGPGGVSQGVGDGAQRGAPGGPRDPRTSLPPCSTSSRFTAISGANCRNRPGLLLPAAQDDTGPHSRGRRRELLLLRTSPGHLSGAVAPADEDVRELLEAIRQVRVLVAGDVCLDRWCVYDPALALASPRPASRALRWSPPR